MQDFSFFTNLSLADLLAHFKISLEKGLNTAAVEASRQKYGSNRLVQKESRWLILLLRQVQSSFVYLLLCAAAISIVLGEYLNGGMVFLVIAVMVFFGFYQEFYVEKTLESLRSRITYHVRVRRKGAI